MAEIALHAPHGPDMTGSHPPITDTAMNLSEKEAFDAIIRPDDSYAPDGTYWADLPLVERVRFVTSYDAKEVKREFGEFWKMFKADPLAPVSWYFRNMVLPGAGLGLEGYAHGPFSLGRSLLTG